MNVVECIQPELTTGQYVWVALTLACAFVGAGKIGYWLMENVTYPCLIKPLINLSCPMSKWWLAVDENPQRIYPFKWAAKRHSKHVVRLDHVDIKFGEDE